VPPDMTDEGLVNLLAQYLPIAPAERQALLELKTVLLRARALVDHIEGKTARPRLQVELSPVR
jgi:hypothetical protein